MYLPDALTATIDQLSSEGLVTASDAALLAALEAMAYQLNEDPSNAALWKTFTTSLSDLTGRQRASDDAFNAILISMSAAVGDTEDT